MNGGQHTVRTPTLEIAYEDSGSDRRLAAPGDPALEPIEERLAGQPDITVPTVVIAGEADGIDPPASDDHDAVHFTNFYERRLIPVAGHFLPREAPEAVVSAVNTLLGR